MEPIIKYVLTFSFVEDVSGSTLSASPVQDLRGPHVL